MAYRPVIEQVDALMHDMIGDGRCGTECVHTALIRVLDGAGLLAVDVEDPADVLPGLYVVEMLPDA